MVPGSADPNQHPSVIASILERDSKHVAHVETIVLHAFALSLPEKHFTSVARVLDLLPQTEKMVLKDFLFVIPCPSIPTLFSHLTSFTSLRFENSWLSANVFNMLAELNLDNLAIPGGNNTSVDRAKLTTEASAFFSRLLSFEFVADGEGDLPGLPLNYQWLKDIEFNRLQHLDLTISDEHGINVMNDILLKAPQTVALGLKMTFGEALHTTIVLDLSHLIYLHNLTLTVDETGLSVATEGISTMTHATLQSIVLALQTEIANSAMVAFDSVIVDCADPEEFVSMTVRRCNGAAIRRKWMQDSLPLLTEAHGQKISAA
ncbi:uncharacterized protein ARMOST_06521 [Armillaria ostoyae]|uniref:F-box domain-containing protein n=1 Tax=Armillaria ostoyae TaxID=47428 RepID=A0A284R3B5_ARMOS|nr:uncharacterized protein ARMOST_06521 [Armillaria ostoyae]